jgi:alpha-aminoadipic semialdehyde synthase
MNTIGIRREDKSRWERRTPIIPEAVAKLVREGIPVRVQPSDNRIFPNEEFVRAGATVDEDLSLCSIVLGVKEIPVRAFHEGTAYAFFSHTIKGQSYNMPMLRRMMDLGCHLVDYEKITDAEGRRLVLFGYHAGLAGMVETLSALGLRLRWEGYETPLASIRSPHAYDSIDEATEAIARASKEIAAGNWPNELRPFVVGFAGYGNVSQGAQHVFGFLDPREADPEELPRVGAETARPNPFVKTVFHEKHMVELIEEGRPFDLQEYYREPSKYRGVFEKHLPYLDVLVNAIYWEEKYPRLVTCDYMRRTWKEGRPRLRVIGDISCDINGSIECTCRPTEPGAPCYVYEPARNRYLDGVEGEGPVVMAVDILPAELPRDASHVFSRALMPFLPALARADFSKELENAGLPDPIRKAVIVHKGRLTEGYRYLASYVGRE